MPRGRTVRELVRDRLVKQGLYDSPGYWDMKAREYAGLARSIWPSNTYNRHWDARQMAIIDATLGDVTGLAVADIACGTGRASRHLARRGARVTGLDFSPGALEAARAETLAEHLVADYRHYDVLGAPDPALVQQFDAALTISCLAMACAEADVFERALANVVSLVRPGGRILFLEPIHASRLLRRILKMGTREWIARCEAHGLILAGRGGMGFVPVRLAMAFRDLPDGCVGPAFRAGEWLLEHQPSLERLSDYKWLLFRRGSPHA